MEYFVIISDQIEGRIDPFFYSPKITQFVDKLGTISTKSIAEIADVICGPFGSSITTKDYTDDKGTPLIRISNIREGHLSSDDIVRIRQELALELTSYRVRENDLVISQRGTLGLAARVDSYFDGAVISANLIAIKNIRQLAPDFLRIFLASKYGKMQLTRKTSGQVQAKITTDDVKSIKVPIIPSGLQNDIVKLTNDAYEIRRQKEAEAQALLNSLSEYVLSELGIELPAFEDKQCYVVGSENLEGQRIDAYYYQPKFEEVERASEKGKYKIISLRNVFQHEFIKGILPKDDEKEGDCRVLQIRNILKTGLISIEEFVTAKDIFSEQHKIKRGEIIIVLTGATIGKVGLWSNGKNEFYLGGDMAKFKPKKDFDSYYIHSFLLSKPGQLQINRYITGATNKHLAPMDIEKIKIPAPPLEFQQTIARTVKERMQKAEALQLEGRDIAEKAIDEAERVILGQ